MNKQMNTYCLEATFDVSNFLHLTGFKTKLTARRFFEKCLDRRLREKDFEFSANGTTPLKLAVLPLLMRNNLSAKMIGDYTGAHPKLYTEKLAGNVSACIGFVQNKDSGKLIPNTILKSDIQREVKSVDRIILTYRKSYTAARYEEVVYAAKNVAWEKVILPEKFAYLKLPVK